MTPTLLDLALKAGFSDPIEGWMGEAYEERLEAFAKLIIQHEAAKPSTDDEPVAWEGYDLDAMVEAFDRVIEAHFNRKNPFHNPIDADAKMALRVLRGFIPYMKSYTRPQPAAQWVGLTDEEVVNLVDDEDWYNDPEGFVKIVEAKLKEKNT